MLQSSNVTESFCLWPMPLQDLIAEIVDLALHREFEASSLESKVKAADS
jgi:hypothetical protein